MLEIVLHPQFVSLTQMYTTLITELNLKTENAFDLKWYKSFHIRELTILYSLMQYFAKWHTQDTHRNADVGTLISIIRTEYMFKHRKRISILSYHGLTLLKGIGMQKLCVCILDSLL